MQIKHHGRVRTGAIAAVSFAALVGTGVLATPASAHTPVWSVTCDKVTVDLTQYNSRVENTVTITVDGKDLLATTSFKSKFHKTLELAKHGQDVSVHLVVKAGDTTAKHNFDKDETKTVAPCKGDESTPPTTTPTTPATTTPTTPATTTPGTPTTPATTPSASPTSSAPVVAPSQSTPPTNLAETGGSSSTPIIGGIAAAVVAAGAGLLFMNRKRRSSHS
ncbi:LAETG motif-containing sortase-dependent surface protein [Streptomyces sp. RKAG293]|uniref:LAETG motif-containing sortase-dependent surface protein n=1 Tax=Streptomyces sp. RKAG293 TaxID=2893403 RepID=UPI0020338264|nr:LAETG motif-containing sortase-dependent surface protein [Streptomyces sp. RKAG293]MCM2418171.1 LPXTG cell wall anchor domain-containing protein [Streptomyces sp. RKAG293]